MNRTTARRTTARRAAAAAVALASLALTAGPAAAAPPDSYASRTSGASADAEWTEYDPDDVLGAPGNVHSGFLKAYKNAEGTDVFGWIEDWQCDAGEVPGYGGHGEEGEEPEEGFCDPMGERFLSPAWDDATDRPLVTLTADVRSGVARLTGRLVVSDGGHGDGTTLGSPAVDMTWTGVGTPFKSTWTETVRDGDQTYSVRARGEGYSTATVSGFIGRMGFTDDEDDTSSGEFRTFREMSRTRIG